MADSNLVHGAIAPCNGAHASFPPHTGVPQSVVRFDALRQQMLAAWREACLEMTEDGASDEAAATYAAMQGIDAVMREIPA